MILSENILEGYEIFFRFLKQDYCEENLLFITEVYEYKNIMSFEKRRIKANEIFTKYIEQNANLEVCTFTLMVLSNLFHCLLTKGLTIDL